MLNRKQIRKTVKTQQKYKQRTKEISSLTWRGKVRHAQENHIFAYEPGPNRKRYSAGVATYAPTTASSPSFELTSGILAGDENTMRLGNAIIATGAWVYGTVYLAGLGISTISDVATRMVLQSTQGAAINSAVTPTVDPYGTYNPDIVPAVNHVWFDTGPLLLTPSTAGPTTIANIDHKVYNFKKYVSFCKNGWNGSFAQYNSAVATSPDTGLIFARFTSDDAGGATVTWKVNFDLEFMDVRASGTALSTEIAQMHKTLETIPKDKDIEKLVEAYLHKRLSPIN